MPEHDWRAYVRNRLPQMAMGAEREREIVDELALQLEAAYDTAVAEGCAHDAAFERAAGEVPDWEALARTLSRIEAAPPPPVVVGAPQGGIMSGLTQDLRYAVRALAKAPGFALVAIATLALGIGATTIVYSLVDGILLRRLPIADSERVVLARELTADGEEFSVSWPNFVDWRARSTSFERLAAWSGGPMNLTNVGHPRRIMTRQVTWNLFDVLGVKPIVGRGLTEADDVPGAERVCLVSHGFWQREMGGSADAVGKTITLDDRQYIVVGVLPADFTIARQEDVFRPIGGSLTPGSPMLTRSNHMGLAAIGRLRPSSTVDSAQAELALIARQLSAEHPATVTAGRSAILRPLFEVLVSTSRPMLRVLLGAAVALLLIACVNLANLLLARSSGRAQELAVRRALGAGGWRIARQLLTESVLIGLCGGIAGTLLAWAGFSAVVSLLPSDQPRIHTVALDLRVLSVAAGVSVLTGILFGLLPALQAASGRSLSLLRSARVAGRSSPRPTTRRALLMAEVALAVVLLSGAGLMLRTMQNLSSIDVGFDPDGVISAQVSLPVARYTSELRPAFYDAVVARTQSIPGVTHAGLTISLPVQGSNWNSVFIVSEQPVPPRADIPAAAFTTVTPGYHETMRIPLVRGRLLQPADGVHSPAVVVVNESFARRFWPEGDAIGRRLKQGWPEWDTPWREIVGVVRDVKVAGVDRPAGLQVYLPLAQNPSSSVALVARTSGDAAALATAVEAAIHSVDRNLPVYDIRTLDDVLGRGVGQQRMTMVFLLGFAMVSLMMAAVGVFGVTACAVSRRTHELGLRMALGASRASVLKLVMTQELSACAAGIAAGVAGALALSSMLDSLLYDVAARDPLTLAGVMGMLVVVTAVAGYLPARKATRIDPARALMAD